MAGTRLKAKLTAIADSIRIKMPSTELMTMDQMPPNIESIVTHEIEDCLITGTLSGAYTNDRIVSTKSYAFFNMYHLTVITMSNLVSLGNNVFSNSTSITYINLPKVMSIGASSFRGLSNLIALNLYDPDRTEIPTLISVNAFTTSSIANGTGYIIINDELVDELKQADNWITYAAQIIGHTQAIALGLITGASATVPAPASLQTTPINRLDIEDVNVDRDLDLDLDLDLENERN